MKQTLSFQQLGLRSELTKALEELLIKSPTEIQQLTFGAFLEGQSFFACGQTGSGKTLAYALPTCQKVKDWEQNPDLFRSELKAMQFDQDIADSDLKPMALIIVPTKELAGQIAKVFKKLSHHIKLKVRSLGGELREAEQIFRDNPNIVIAVPGALRHWPEKGWTPSLVIADEADQIFDESFARDMQSFFHKCRTGVGIQWAFFTATMTPDHVSLANKWLAPLKVSVTTVLQDGQTNRPQKSIRTFNIELPEKEKNLLLPHFLKREGLGKGIIFVNKKETAAELFKLLESTFAARKVYHLHGGLDHKDRKVCLKSFRLAERGILVSTDIMARGMHLEGLEWVLNYDLPFEASYYLHRVGRVGRGSEIGRAYNFCTPRDLGLIDRINSAIKNQQALPLETLQLKKIKRMDVSQSKKAKMLKKAVKKVGPGGQAVAPRQEVPPPIPGGRRGRNLRKKLDSSSTSFNQSGRKGPKVKRGPGNIRRQKQKQGRG